MVDAGAAVLERKSGIIIPAGGDALSKRPRSMARKKFLLLYKSMKRVREDHGLVMRFTCVICHQPVQLQRGESSILQTDRSDNTVDPRKDRFSMSCACTVWTVKK